MDTTPRITALDLERAETCRTASAWQLAKMTRRYVKLADDLALPLSARIYGSQNLSVVREEARYRLVEMQHYAARLASAVNALAAESANERRHGNRMMADYLEDKHSDMREEMGRVQAQLDALRAAVAFG